MEPNAFGRKLGIGMRVAGRIARDRAREASAQRAASTATPASTTAPPPPASSRQVFSEQAKRTAERSRNLGRGVGQGARNFKQSFFGPLFHVSGVLWLEITGCFFALFTLFFAQNVYRVRAQYAAGPEHRSFVLYAVLTLIFGWFSLSSFLRARLRSRKRSS